MPILIPRKHSYWLRKPQGDYEINQNHDIGSRIILANNDKLFNHVNVSYDSGDANGEGRVYGSVNSYSERINDVVSGAQKRAVFAILKRNNIGSSNGIISFDDGAGGTANTERWTFRFDDTDLRIEVAGGGDTSLISVNTDKHAVGISFDGTNLGGHRFYAQNLETGDFSAENAGGSTAVNTANENVYMGVNLDTSSSNRGLDGSLYDCWLFDGELSDDEFRELAEAPYQVIKPRSKLFAFPVEAGAPSLSVNDISQSQTLSQAALTQHNVLSSNDIAQAQELEQVALVHHAALSVDGLQQDHVLSQPVLTQHNVLSVDDLQQAQELGQVTLGVGGVLVANDIQQLQEIGESVLTQHNVLIVGDLQQAQDLSQVSLAGSVVLSANDLQQAQDLSQSVLLVAFSLLVDDLQQAQNLAQSALTEHSVLVVGDLTQNQLLSLVDFGAPVIGCLDGKIVIATKYGGKVDINPLLDGDVIIH